MKGRLRDSAYEIAAHDFGDTKHITLLPVEPAISAPSRSPWSFPERAKIFRLRPHISSFSAFHFQLSVDSKSADLDGLALVSSAPFFSPRAYSAIKTEIRPYGKLRETLVRRPEGNFVRRVGHCHGVLCGLALISRTVNEGPIALV